MPRWFSDLSLRAKFVAVTMLVGTVSTVFVTGVFLVYANASTKSSLVSELSALAQVLAKSSGAALVFNDPSAAESMLSTIRVRPDVIGGQIIGANGEVFAYFGTMPDPQHDGYSEADGAAHHIGDYLWVRQLVRLDGETVGSVELAASLEVLRRERNALLTIALVIVLLSTVIAYALSTTLQRALVRPITHLADVMRRVSAEKAYGYRAERDTDDELGQLITGFNQMLGQVEAQHSELALYRAELERLVDERTNQLRETNAMLTESVANLQASKAELEATNRYKSEFLANMSHELRTPLNAIIGFSEIMVKQIFGPLGDSRYEQYAKDIGRSAAHLVGIIGDILDTTRMESGNLELREEVVSAGSLVDDAVRITSPLIEAKGIELRWPKPIGDDDALRCDPMRVRQILINLLSNAVKFTEAGGVVSIDVTVDREISISISDTGIGIAEGDLQRVLTPFAQVETTFSRRHQGTGLGLSLSKTLMEHHQGQLTLRSQLGEGTTVLLVFPESRTIARTVL